LREETKTERVRPRPPHCDLPASHPGARRDTLKAVFPAWMAADPGAARAAPLTLLERGRWQQQAIFLRPAR
jgi:hypothetical protein